jgi:hypothetical protein
MFLVFRLIKNLEGVAQCSMRYCESITNFNNSKCFFRDVMISDFYKVVEICCKPFWKINSAQVKNNIIFY